MASPVCGNTVNCTGRARARRPAQLGPGASPRARRDGAARPAARGWRQAGDAAQGAARRDHGADLLAAGGRRAASGGPGSRPGPAASPGSAASFRSPQRGGRLRRHASARRARRVRTRPARRPRPPRGACTAITRPTPRQAIVSPDSPATPANFSGLYLQAVLIKVDSQATLERVRTFLITHTSRVGLGHRAADVRRGGPGPAGRGHHGAAAGGHRGRADADRRGMQPGGRGGRRPGRAEAAVHDAAPDRNADGDAVPGGAGRGGAAAGGRDRGGGGHRLRHLGAHGGEDGAGRHSRCRTSATCTT